MNESDKSNYKDLHGACEKSEKQIYTELNQPDDKNEHVYYELHRPDEQRDLLLSNKLHHQLTRNCNKLVN